MESIDPEERNSYRDCNTWLVQYKSLCLYCRKSIFVPRYTSIGSANILCQTLYKVQGIQGCSQYLRKRKWGSSPGQLVSKLDMNLPTKLAGYYS